MGERSHVIGYCLVYRAGVGKTMLAKQIAQRIKNPSQSEVGRVCVWVCLCVSVCLCACVNVFVL
jgi:hypothetical protein